MCEAQINYTDLHFIHLSGFRCRRFMRVAIHPANRAFLWLAKFGVLERVRPLLSMRGMLRGYSLEPRSNSHALATVGSVMTIGSC